MPYVNCPNCRLTVYSAVRYSTQEDCPRCSASLGGVRSLFPLAPPVTPGFLDPEARGGMSRPDPGPSEGPRTGI